METLLPDLAWIDGAFRPGRAIDLAADGTLAGVRTAAPGERGLRLAGRALLPGFVDAHSHAFQRALRGRTEFRNPDHPTDDFWSWREQMYGLAARLEPEDLEAVARMAFVELALAGVTSVGEFHYLHHPPGGGVYREPDELAHRLAAAARDAGITPVLLRVAYARAGHGRPPDPPQARFVERSPDEAMAAIERLAARGIRVGVAPHSLRAVPLPWIRELSRFARERRLPFHLHAGEQPREVRESREEHGLPPVAVLARDGLLDERTTLVHGVHLAPEEIAAAGAARSTVCACPTTDRNLGDGIVPAAALLDAGVSIALGTDSHVQTAPLENARELEYHLRLVTLRRAILGNGGGPEAIAARLLQAATAAGARSLGLDAGELRPGAAGDLVAFDLDDPSIAGASGETLLPTIVFGAERTAVTDVWARGRRIVADRRHPALEAARREFGRTMGRIWR